MNGAYLRSNSSDSFALPIHHSSSSTAGVHNRAPSSSPVPIRKSLRGGASRGGVIGLGSQQSSWLDILFLRNREPKDPYDKGYSRLHRRRRRQQLVLILVAFAIMALTFVLYHKSYFSNDSHPDIKSDENNGDSVSAGASSSNPPCPEDDKDKNNKADDHVPQPSSFGGAVSPGYFFSQDAIKSSQKDADESVVTEFRFVAIADNDQRSKVEGGRKPKFVSQLLSGILTRRQPSNDSMNSHDNLQDAASNSEKGSSASDMKPQYSISFDEGHTRSITTKLSEGGRGGEFSELALYQNRLITVDDRTGAVFELLNNAEGNQTRPVPRYIFTEGNGEDEKGMKFEWMTVKGGDLYIGGIGKEMQLSDGTVDHSRAMWIVIIHANGSVERLDWSPQYDFVRSFVGCQLPGYMAHEAVRWSAVKNKWIFLPRRVSFHQYVPELDERLGSNKVVIVEADFSHATAINIDLQHHEAGLRGFSSFAFIPGSEDEHVLAIRSVEENCVGANPAKDEHCEFRSYASVFELYTGEVLMEEVQLPQPVKFEGVEFANIHVRPKEGSAAAAKPPKEE